MNKDKAALDLLDEVSEIARSGDLQGTLLKVADIIADNVQLRSDLECLADAKVLLHVADKALPDFGGGTRVKEFRNGYARFNRGEQVIGLTSWQDGRESMRKERDALLQRNAELIELLKSLPDKIVCGYCEYDSEPVDAALKSTELTAE